MLKGNQIQLRALEPEDLSLLFDWENRSELWHVSQTMQPFSKHVLKQYLANQHVDVLSSGQLRLMIEKEGQAIGTVELFEVDSFHARAGVGIMIADTDNRGKGYALEALDLLAEYCFSHLQLHQLFCHIDTDNKASIKLFEKAGYQKAGVKKDWVRAKNGFLDLFLYQLIRRK